MPRTSRSERPYLKVLALAAGTSLIAAVLAPTSALAELKSPGWCNVAVNIEATDLDGVPSECVDLLETVEFKVTDSDGDGYNLPVPDPGSAVSIHVSFPYPHPGIEASLENLGEQGLEAKLFVGDEAERKFATAQDAEQAVVEPAFFATEVTSTFAFAALPAVAALTPSQQTAKCNSNQWWELSPPGVQEGNFTWKYNSDNQWSSNSLDYIEAAGNAIENAYNNCGISDGVSANQSYSSYPTQAKPNIGSHSCMTSTDDQNIIGWGYLINPEQGQPAPLAVVCNFRSGGVSYEADMKINYDDYPWSTNTTSNWPSSSYDLRGVITHEFGHIFGLRDMYGDTLAKQTQVMYGYSATCGSSSPANSKDKRWLGAGDLLGLHALY